MIHIARKNKVIKGTKKTKKKPPVLIGVLLKWRGDDNGGHNHVIMDTFEDYHVSVGTTTKKTKGANSKSKNYSCKNDILGNGQRSYLRRQATVAKINTYGKSSSGRMTSEDYAQAKVYAQRAKEKFSNNKEKKQ